MPELSTIKIVTYLQPINNQIRIKTQLIGCLVGLVIFIAQISEILISNV